MINYYEIWTGNIFIKKQDLFNVLNTDIITLRVIKSYFVTIYIE